MSVDSLTDSELRTKLAEYGYPVGPVTLTTRKILVKKLKNLIESRGGSGSRHSLAARYSSDDTDDDIAATSIRKKKATAMSNRRQTMANPMPPPASAPAPIVSSAPKSPSKRRAGSRNSESKEASDYDDATVNSTTRSTTKIVQKKTKSFKLSTVNDGLETGSDSDITEDPDKVPTKFGTEITKPSFESRKDRNSADVETTSKTYETKPRPSNLRREEKYTLPPFKPNISPIAPVKDDPPYKRDDLTVNDILATYESPYLSEFTRRLSTQATSVPPRSNFKSSMLRHTTQTRPETKETDTNGHFSSLRSAYSATSSRFVSSSNDKPRDAVTRTYKTPVTKPEESRNNQNMVSMVLVIGLALFFGVLAIVYLGLGGKTEVVPALPMDKEVPLCSHSDHHRPGVNCLLNEDVETVMQLLKRLKPILTKRAVAAACEDTSDAPYITDLEVINMLKSNKVREFEITGDLHNAQLLIFENPKWGISLVEVDEGSDISEHILDSMEKVFQARLEGKVGMVMLNPELPVKCLIKQKVFTVLSTLFIGAIGIATILGLHKSIQWYIKQKKSAERDVFHLVSEIISIVETHHQNAATMSPGGTEASYIAISHVRDNLIPPKDRRKMAGVWQKAVKFLDQNESRIRREDQEIAGENFEVWRWLPNLNTSNAGSPAANKKSKVWQGQAFETMEGSVNSPTISPTPCLKIRHMFDLDVEIEDDWEVKVQDAILEKCGEGVKILHITVDRGSREGCVYMKCLTHDDAGKSYRALHGWWFDGHLVTVKYLRLERYHERFPDAVRCTQPLKPSNNQRLSMQANSWQTPSPLEAN